MPSVAELVSQYSGAAAAKNNVELHPNSTVARMIAHYEVDLDLDGLGPESSSNNTHIRHVHSVSSSSFSSCPSTNDINDAHPFDSHSSDQRRNHRHTRVPGTTNTTKNPTALSVPPASSSPVCDHNTNNANEIESLTRKYGDQVSLHPMQHSREQAQNFPLPKHSALNSCYHHREPSNSSTIRSNDSSRASTSSFPYRSDDSSRRLSPTSFHAGDDEDDDISGDYQYSDIYATTEASNRAHHSQQPSLADKSHAHSDIIKRPLPKAKVVIARRRPQSADLDAQVSSFGPLSPRDDAVSAPGLPSFDPLFDQVPVSKLKSGNRKLVTDYTDPEELRRGRISLINLMATNVESVALGEDEDPDFDYVPPPVSSRGGRIYGNQKEIDAAAQRRRNPAANYDDFMDPEAMMRQVDADTLYDEGPSKKRNKAGRFFKLKARNENRNKESRRQAESQEDALQRRSFMVSGAIERISTAADPFVDFITNARPVGGAPQKGRFSRFMARLFGSKASRDRNTPKSIMN